MNHWLDKFYSTRESLKGATVGLDDGCQICGRRPIEYFCATWTFSQKTYVDRLVCVTGSEHFVIPVSINGVANDYISRIFLQGESLTTDWGSISVNGYPIKMLVKSKEGS